MIKEDCAFYKKSKETKEYVCMLGADLGHCELCKAYVTK